MPWIEIGRVLRASTAGFVVGCRVNQLEAPAFGALVRGPQDGNYQVFGIIHDIRVDDDGLVRQLVTADNVSAEVLRDNRERRIVPIELSVLAVGFELNGNIRHLLPPRPPLSLDVVYLCDQDGIRRFTQDLGYLRHIVNSEGLPVGDLLAAHMQQAGAAHADLAWRERATEEVIALLRDDPAALMPVLGALRSGA